MTSQWIILLILALIFGLYMAWNIGANDVANAMGTSVGSGALTLKRAVILAAIMEFCGAFLLGPHVSETVSKGIVDPKLFTGEPMLLALGMLGALLAAGVWLQLATYCGWPVSPTHSIVGAVVGFGVVYGGLEAVDWGQMGSIVLSWVISPLMSGFIAFVIFRLVLTHIFYKPDPVGAAKKATPYIVFAVIVTMMLVLAFKGLKPFWKYPFWEEQFGLKIKSHLDLFPLTISLSAAVVAGILGSLISKKLVSRLKGGDPLASEQVHKLYVSRALSKAIMHLRRARNTSNEKVREATDSVIQQTKGIHRQIRDRADTVRTQSVYGQVERIFIYLQIISAAFVAFAHGANDVANAIGPLSIVIETALTMKVPENPVVPLWILGLGGIGIVAGLATWGWRVILTIGKRLTELTPSRGFCAEFAAALTILIASVYKLPISTTHTLVGAVLGVGLARGIRALNLNVVRDIAISWVVTVPAGAGLSILFFLILRAAFQV